jgi:exopolysaccharide production protein ExoQ
VTQLSGPTRRADWLVAAVSVFVLTGALDRGVHALAPADAPLPLARIIVIPCAAAAMVLLGRRPRAALAAIGAAWPLLLPVVVATLSWWWSSAPAVTARWAAGLAATTAIGLFLAVRLDVDEQLDAICLGLGTAAAVSAALIVLAPRIGIRHSGAWVGAFEDNNLFGRVMALTFIACLADGLDRWPHRWPAAAGGALAAALVWRSRSLTASVVALGCLLVLGVSAMYRRGRLSRGPIAAGIAAILLAGAAAMHDSTRVAAWLGRDPSLSGRTILWTDTVRLGVQRLWIGRGYGTFWPTAEAAPDNVLHHRGAPVRHPHNGMLEIWFELGLLGTAAVLVPFAILLVRAIPLAVTPPPRRWPLVYFVFLALANLTESDFLRHKVFWAVYVAVGTGVFSGTYRAPIHRLVHAVPAGDPDPLTG